MAAQKKQRLTQTLGVKPLGNAFLEGNSARFRGLGFLARFSDTEILALWYALSPEDVVRAGQCSPCLYCFVRHDAFWRDRVLLELGGEFDYEGTWWATYGTWRRGHTTMEVRLNTRLCSDVLYSPCRENGFEIYPHWLSVDTLQRSKPAELTAKRFRQEFDAQQKPVIMTRLSENWPALQKWRMCYLSEVLSALPCDCLPSPGGKTARLTLQTFLRCSISFTEEYPLLACFQDVAISASVLTKDYTALPHFPIDLFQMLGSQRPCGNWLQLGPARAGQSWNISPHAVSTWTAVVRGRQKWFLLPPTTDSNGSRSLDPSAWKDMHVMEWLSKHYDNVQKSAAGSKDLHEGICGPGDVIFVPSGWWCANFNLEDDTVTITQSYVSPANLAKVRDALSKIPVKSKGLCNEVCSLDVVFDEALRDAGFNLNKKAPETHEHAMQDCTLAGEAAKKHSRPLIEDADQLPGKRSFWDHMRKSRASISFSRTETDRGITEPDRSSTGTEGKISFWDHMRKSGGSISFSRSQISTSQSFKDLIPARRSVEPADSIAMEPPLGITRCHVPAMGGRCVKTTTSFKVGDVIFQETPLCWVETCDAEDALKASLALDSKSKAMFREMHADVSLPSLQGRPEDERHVLSVWDLNAYTVGESGRALLPWIARIPHSCSPNVIIQVLDQTGKVLAASEIAEGEILMSWYPEDEFLLWADSKTRRSALKKVRAFDCGCERCHGPDVCREIACANCTKSSDGGFLRKMGQVDEWKCEKCGVSTTDGFLAPILNAEEDLCKKAIRILRTCARPGARKQRPPEDLHSLLNETNGCVGDRHWIHAFVMQALHHNLRNREPRVAFHYGLRFLDWVAGQVVRNQIWGGRFPPGYLTKGVYEVALWCIAKADEVIDITEGKQNEDCTLFMTSLLGLAVRLSDEVTWAQDQNRLHEYRGIQRRATECRQEKVGWEDCVLKLLPLGSEIENSMI